MDASNSSPAHLTERAATIPPSEMTATSLEPPPMSTIMLPAGDKSFDHMFLYDGKDLYFFLDEVTLIVGNKEITLSPMSYVSCSYLNMVEYYDYSNDKYVTIELGNENVYVKNDYMNIDVSLDKVIYKDSFNLIGGKLSNYKKITDMEEK